MSWAYPSSLDTLQLYDNTVKKIVQNISHCYPRQIDLLNYILNNYYTVSECQKIYKLSYLYFFYDVITINETNSCRYSIVIILMYTNTIHFWGVTGAASLSALWVRLGLNGFVKLWDSSAYQKNVISGTVDNNKNAIIFWQKMETTLS